MSHDKHKTREHAAETVLLLGSVALASVAVLPSMGIASWMPPLIEIMAGIVIGFSVWAGTGRAAISAFCAAYGISLGAWTLWAELAHLWTSAVIAAWIVGMIVACPTGMHAALSRHPLALPPGADPKAIEAPEIDLAAEMAKFEHMFNEINCAGVQVLDLVEERPGRVLRLQLPRSGKVTISTLETAANQIGVILRLKPGAVEFETGAHSGDIIMRLREREVLVEAPRLRPEVHASTINEPFAIGVQEDGSVLKVTLRELHMFIVGTTGAGKSNLVNVLLTQLSYCVDTVIWVIDMKGGRTARPWLQAWVEGNADAPAIDWVATSREEAALMMGAYRDAIETRMNSGIGGSKITPSASMPQIILICDETADLLGYLRGSRKDVGESGTTNAQLIKLAEEIAQKGRSEAASTAWATQRGTNDMSGSGTLKSLCKLRIALGASTESDLRYVIPDARIAQKQLSTMATTPGVGIVAVGRRSSMLSKFFWHDHIDGQCSENGNEGCVSSCPVYLTSIDVGSIRPRLDKITAEPLGEVYAERWQRAEHLLRRPVPAGGVAVADVDTSTFDDIVRGEFDQAEKINPARRRMREILSSQGVRGSTPNRILTMLESEGLGVARETLQRWLAADASEGILHSADFGRWVIGPGESKAA